MATYLGYTAPFAGHLYPMVGLLHALRQRGHDVRLAIGPSALDRSLASQPGAPRPIDEGTWLGVEVCRPRGGDEQMGELNHVQIVGEHSEFEDYVLYGAPAAAELTKLVRDERPDYLILDSMLWGAIPAAEASGRPWAVLAHTAGSLPTLRPRLFGPGLAPPNNVVRRVRQQFAASAMRRIQDLQLLPHINALRQSYKVRPLDHAFENTFGAAVTVACTAEPFEYPRDDWHPSVRFVGPIEWDAPSKSPDWLQQLDGRPVVLVCTSSVPQADERLVQVALELSDAADLQLVVTTPSYEFADRRRPNLWIERYVPHSVLLPITSCVVCHAGLGITQRALLAGVPVVACPFERDQLEVARRVEVSKAGVRIPESDLNAPTLKRAVAQAMRCVDGARRIATIFESAGGARAAAIALDYIN